MEIKIDRRFKGDTYTISSLFIDGVYFCDALEDKVRDLGKDGKGKIKGKTAIPSGRYRVIVTPSPRFKRLLPLLLNVPFFEGIRIHAGNDEEDTEGCILVGENKVKGKVINSKITFAKLFYEINETIKSGEEVWITVAE